MMLSKTTTAISVLAALTSLSAQAVRHGNDVTEANYRDHTVRFQLSSTSGATNTCGGLLIAGEYILTAGHCIGDNAYTANYSEYIPWLDGGASNSISVFKGIEYDGVEFTTTYSNLDVYGSFESEYNSVISELTYLETVHGASKFANQRTWQDLDWTRKTGARDIALIKLASKIPQQHQASIKPIFDSASNTYNVESGDSFTFRGWGRDENNSVPTVMQETTLELSFTQDQYNPNKPVETSDTTILCSGSSSDCEIRIKDRLTIKPTVVTGTASSGDSGTPMLIANDAVLIASSESGDHSQNLFTNIGSYLENIATLINKVTAPSSMTFDIDENSTNTIVSTFKVQNLTQFTDSVSPSLTGDTHNFTITGCGANMNTYDSCELTLTLNPNGTAQTEDSDVVLHLNDTDNTTIPISLTVTPDSTDTTDPTDPTDPDEGEGSTSTGGGSGGGSTSLLSILGLLALIRLRKSK
ncbi:trypsin-like serine protease [Vibrio cyclitrophicus]|uniref:trypsin-like serine protease n=1 Tax=Vibrio cyclitrophicus TaxID=47951 RepID=UPI0032E4F089